MKWKLFLSSLLLSGCQVGPQYIPPVLPVPDEWHHSIPQDQTSIELDCFNWWESLQDPLLTCLIKRATEQNLDLSIAGIRILTVRLEKTGKMAALYPRLDGTLTAGHLYFKNDHLLREAFGKCSKCSHQHQFNFFEAGFDASWEIDLFGYHQHQVKTAEAKIEATNEVLRDTWTTLTAEVARHYIQLRTSQQRLQLLEQQIEIQNIVLSLQQELLVLGVASSLEVLQLEKNLDNLKIQQSPLELSIHTAMHHLAVLLGSNPNQLIEELQTPQDLPTLPCTHPIGLPSDLLRRRPDIRRAERELAAATESIGTAIAALFPRLSLYGFIGDVGAQLKSCTNGNGLTWFAAPQLLFPIFNSRLLQQDVCYNKLQAQQALFEYQKTVLNALEEVENALATFDSELKQQHFLDRSLKNAQDAYVLIQDLYERGLKDTSQVLAQKQEWISAQDAELQNQSRLLLQYISLYKALGGGWDLAQVLEEKG